MQSEIRDSMKILIFLHQEALTAFIMKRISSGVGHSRAYFKLSGVSTLNLLYNRFFALVSKINFFALVRI